MTFTHTSKPHIIVYTTTVRKMFRLVETLKENSVPSYMGIVLQIQTTSHKQEPYNRLSDMWALTVLIKVPIIN